MPAAVIASRGESVGAVGPLRTEQPSKADEEGKDLFIQTCKSCHTLDAVGATGVTGPDLDTLGGVDQAARSERHQDRRHRQTAACRPGSYRARTPTDVARYVAKVAGQ